jgi:glucose-6-phosphate 1-epimerase
MDKPSVVAELPDSVALVDGAGGLPLFRVSTPTTSGEVYLHGAHISAWAPPREDTVIWMSKASVFAPAEPIRGGIPICFPWFGPGRDAAMSPVHGFARLAQWALVGAEDSDGAVTLTFRLTDSEVAGLASVQFWPHPFELTYAVTFGAELAIDLTVRNTGEEAYSFEEALHTYFAVKDIAGVTIEGLDGLQFLDRAPNAPTEPAPQVGAVTFAGEIDRVYSSTGVSTIFDPAGRRVITVAKDRSANTVVWNPWSAKAAAMPDFGDDEWPKMVCVETANVLHHAVTLGAGDVHTMSTRYSVSHPSEGVGAQHI